MVPPIASGAPEIRVSSARTISIGTNRPAAADTAGRKAPVTSMTMSVPLDANTSMAPFCNATMPPLARMSPAAQFSTDDVGRPAPAG